MPTPTASPNFKMALGPLKFTAPHAPAAGKVVLWNEGAKPLNVTANTLHLSGTCGNLHISPDRFTLAAGHHISVTVTDNVPNADLAARFTGQLPGSKGVTANGAMAARFVTGTPSDHTECSVHVAQPTPVAHGGGFPLWAVAAIAAVVLLAVVVVIRKLRKGRNTA